MAITKPLLEKFDRYILGSSTELITKNPVLQPGELGIESDTTLVKLGTGDRWNDTTYVNSGGVVGEGIASQATLTEISQMVQIIMASEILGADEINGGYWGA